MELPVTTTTRSSVRVLAWTAFWLMVFGFGMTQAWEFSDIPPKPWLIPVLGPIGFWAPMMYAFGPIMMLKTDSMRMLWLLAAGWSVLLAGAIVAVENAWSPRATGRFSWSTIVGLIAALAVLRVLAAILPAIADGVYIVSSVLLVVPVAIGWLSLLLLPIVIFVPRLRGNLLQSRW
jgi:hypothetical protein